MDKINAIILNYFVKGDTNAKAETINSKIQRFIMMNRGTRDKEFFYFRLAKLFSSAPQNRISPSIFQIVEKKLGLNAICIQKFSIFANSSL